MDKPYQLVRLAKCPSNEVNSTMTTFERYLQNNPIIPELWYNVLSKCFENKTKEEGERLFLLIVKILNERTISEKFKEQILSLAISKSFSLFKQIHEFLDYKFSSTFLFVCIENLSIEGCNYVLNLIEIDDNFKLTSNVPYEAKYHNVKMMDVWMDLIFQSRVHCMLFWLKDHELPIDSADHSDHIWKTLLQRAKNGVYMENIIFLIEHQQVIIPDNMKSEILKLFYDELEYSSYTVEDIQRWIPHRCPVFSKNDFNSMVDEIRTLVPNNVESIEETLHKYCDKYLL